MPARTRCCPAATPQPDWSPGFARHPAGRRPLAAPARPRTRPLRRPHADHHDRRTGDHDDQGPAVRRTRRHQPAGRAPARPSSRWPARTAPTPTGIVRRPRLPRTAARPRSPLGEFTATASGTTSRPATRSSREHHDTTRRICRRPGSDGDRPGRCSAGPRTGTPTTASSCSLLVPGKKMPAVEKDWEHAATTDHLTIARIWRQAPYNIGVATGPSRLLVVDLDLPKHPADLPPDPWRSRGAVTGADVLALVADDAGSPATPATYTVTTPSGGQHLYFRQPVGASTRQQRRAASDGRSTPEAMAATSSAPDQSPTTASTLATTTAAGRSCPAGSPHSTHQPHPYAAAQHRYPQSGHSTPTPWPHSPANSTNSWPRPKATQRHPQRAAFALGQLVGAQLLDQATARDELISAAGRIGLPRAEAERTITSGLTAGAPANPARDPPNHPRS